MTLNNNQYEFALNVPDCWTDFDDETEETINNYELGGMPKFYEVK